MKGFIKDEIPSRWDGNQMTHDELLQKIDYYFDTDNFHIHKNALRAVVELCRDYSGAYPNASEEFENGLTVAFALVIQAIEKELA
jgi:hypothetical protein